MVDRGQRWVEVTPSQFPHEAEGLNLIRSLLPDVSPFRAWSNLEFRDRQGKWHEIDLLVLGRRRLHLVELKHYAGTLRGDDLRWLRDGHRAEDSPLLLARRKAQRLASKLREELLRWAREHNHDEPDPNKVIPYVQECVFLHHPRLVCTLAAGSRIDLFGLDGEESRTGLPGISERLLESPTSHQSVTRDETLAALMTTIGLGRRRQREAGSWVIGDQPLGEGEDWQDWPARHRVSDAKRSRIRFLIPSPGAPASEVNRLKTLADHEYRVMTRLAHDALLRPEDLVETDLGVGLVYPDDDRLQRLDLWLADQAGGIALVDQLSIVRQVAEAVGYAHGNRVVHRGLTPNAVRLRRLDDGSLKVTVADWQSAGSTGSSAGGSSPPGVTSLFAGPSQHRLSDLPDDDQGGELRHPADGERRFAESFQAPEGVWTHNADRIRLDVFSLGALAYYLFAGRAPASDRTSLRDRLNRTGGLDLAADLPQVPSAVRTLVLASTHPAVGKRLPDVGSFLQRLAIAEQAITTTTDEPSDPLDATPGALLAGRFTLERRLGAGSTAVGLLVTDQHAGSTGEDATRVLKVAVDDVAATRLETEAQVLETLDHPRLVRMIEGPLKIGNRTALLLASAGTETLADVLKNRTRLSLDLLDRYGTDLLDALVALDRAGTDHRDIKPANLGLQKVRDSSHGDRAKHLVLFDFSLSRAAATALAAGTPPYLDPFLAPPKRPRFDSAAERYAAAVVLFEMATGTVPVYGDPMAHPASVTDEATITADLFDRSVATAMTGFFTKALARDVRDRHDTAELMLAAWQSAFVPVPKTRPDDAETRVAAATPSTPIAESGLSARALSALEPFGIGTVGGVVTLTPSRLSHLPGVANATRREILDRHKLWRERFGSAASTRSGTPVDDGAALPPLIEVAERLVASAGPARSRARRALAALLLGVPHDDATAEVDAFVSQAELSRVLGVPRAKARQQVEALLQAWTANAPSRTILDGVEQVVREALADLSGVATVDELAGAVLAAAGPAPGSVASTEAERRIAAGLLRLALDRRQLLEPPGAGEPLNSRRRDGRVALLAVHPGLLDAADALGREADRLLAEAVAAGERLVSPRRAVPVLRAALVRMAGGVADLPDARLLRLAAALATQATLSGANEFHERDLDLSVALSLALKGVSGSHGLAAQEVRDRVLARFPALPLLPDRPHLDDVVEAARVNLVFDVARHVFRPRTRAGDTTGLESRVPTQMVPIDTAFASDGHAGQRLTESARTRSFLALGVDARRCEKAIAVLAHTHRAHTLDVTGVLIETMRSEVEQMTGLTWRMVQDADAAPAGSRDARGLAALVARALPTLQARIDTALDATPGPLLLVEAGPLARYGALAVLSRWTDLASPRGRAVWLLVPQLIGNTGPVIDGRPLPLAAPSQFFRLDGEWIDTHFAEADTDERCDGAVPAPEGAL
ncbi:MAG: BREX system serine/threonine kinase PglW [Kineosporiaceae bacterium]